MRRLAWRISRTLALTYVLAVIGLWALQRQILFRPPQRAEEPHMPGGVLLRLPLAGGGSAVAYYVAARRGAPTLVFFHGNGDQLADAVYFNQPLHALGLGVLSVEYPGYGLAASTSVSETAINASADTVLTYLHRSLRVPPERVVIEGWSLGTGVAAEMARRGHAARLVLVSPYTSIADMAAERYPFMPVRALVRDRFDTAAIAPHITIPVLIVHGTADPVIPYAMGQRLARLFPHATLVSVPGRGHTDLFDDGGDMYARIEKFALGSVTR